MSKQENTNRQKAGRLKITQEDVIRIVGYKMKAKGLEAAEELFKLLNDNFSTERGWPETAAGVYAMFDEERERLKEQERVSRQRQHTEEVELARAGAPLILQSNTNEASGIKDGRQWKEYDVDQWNNMIEKGAKVSYKNWGGQDNDTRC